MSKEVLFKIEGLKKHFDVGKKQVLKAVNGVSFEIYKGETLGLVGESGCGKTTCGRTILNLYPKTEGNITYKGKSYDSYNKSGWKNFKKECQMIFQDPYASLDPRMTIGEIVAEGMEVHFNYSREEQSKKVIELLAQVGLVEDYASRFAHELSGGQRQRIGIARALAMNPEFIVCDEPISALDVSIQAQIVNLLIKMQKDLSLTYLFISHDLSMVRHISDRIAVMYLGNLVELADVKELYNNPLHPYTKALLSAIPQADPDVEASRQAIHLEGEVPSPVNPPSGCTFHQRCAHAMDICKKEVPVSKIMDNNHRVACHLFN